MKCYVLISSIHPSFLLHLVSVHLSIDFSDNARMHVLELITIRIPNYWNMLLWNNLRLLDTLTFDHVYPVILFYADTFIFRKCCCRTHYYSDMQHDSLRIKANLDTPFDREMLNFIKVGSRAGQGHIDSPSVYGTACLGKTTP